MHESSVYVMTGAAHSWHAWGLYGVTDRSHLLQLDSKNREFAFLCFVWSCAPFLKGDLNIYIMAQKQAGLFIRQGESLW